MPTTALPPSPHIRDDDIVAFGRYQLLPSLRLLLRDGIRIDVGERAVEVLSVLVASPGEVVSKDALLSRVWPQEVVEENNLQAQISALRKALGTDRQLIATEFSRGYRFTGTVHAHQSHQAHTAQLEGVVSHSLHSAPCGLPRPRSPLVGRTEEMRALQRILATRSLCTLTGPAGIGKTRLAIEAASAASACFADGIYFFDLSQTQSADAVAPGFAAALAGRYANSMPAAPDAARALLVVDNCEQLAAACARELEQLLQNDPLLSVLLTSQTPLGMDDEQVYRLGPLALPAAGVDAAEAARCSAVELFVRRVKSADYGFELAPDNVREVVELCRALDGIPLALEIAAARVPSLGLDTVTQDLSRASGLLEARQRGNSERHQSLGHALRWSYLLLQLAEQQVFQELAVFPGDFDGAAAEAVLSPEARRAGRTLDTIASLVDKSLLAPQAGTQPLRYRYLSMLRAYALEQLGERIEAVAERYVGFVAQRVAQAKHDWMSLSTSQWRRQYVHHIDDIRAALDRSLQQQRDHPLGLRILADAAPFWIQLSLHDECRQRMSAALAAPQAPAFAPQQTMVLHAALGTALTWSRGPGPENGLAWTRASDLATELGDREMQLQSAYGLWLHHTRGGRYVQSLHHARHMEELAEEADDPAASLTARRLIGTCQHFLGDQQLALPALEAMLERYVRDDHRGSPFRFGLDQRVVGWAFMSRTLWLTGQPAQARRAAQLAVEEAMELDHACSLCCALIEGSCSVAALSGDVDQVLRLVPQIEQVAAEHGLEFWRLYASAFGLWARMMQTPQTVSPQRLSAALAQFQRNGVDPGYSVLFALLAQALLQCGAAQEANALLTDRLDRLGPALQLWSAPELLRLQCLARVEAAGNAASHASANAPSDMAANAAGTPARLTTALVLARRQGASAWEARITATAIDGSITPRASACAGDSLAPPP
jgi:predicted ATPase/DNA-binding winged helix-turn-helix (wHTH) protein